MLTDSYHAQILICYHKWQIFAWEFQNFALWDTRLDQLPRVLSFASPGEQVACHR